MYHKILLPVDESQVSTAVAREGLRLAKESGAQATVLAVVERLPGYRSLTPTEWEARQQEYVAAAKDRLAGLGAYGHKLGVDVRQHLRFGAPEEEIVKTAYDDRADLIVMASHHGRISTLLLGSVAQEVLRQAHCPVLIYGMGAHPQEDAEMETRNEVGAG